MTSIITNEIEERYPYPDNGERPTGITRLGQCLASRKAYRAGVCRKITDREIDMAALAVYTGTPSMTRRIRLTPAMRGLLLDMYETGSAYPLDRNHRRTFDALEERDYIEHVSWGRWRITPLGETIAKQLTAKERNH